MKPTPYELWIQAGRESLDGVGQSERYAELMVEHGHLQPIPPCPSCPGRKPFNHRHDEVGATIPTDIFGHDKRPLTEDQVNALEEGTVVDVIWTGGNGPHRYSIHVQDGLRYAATLDGNPRMLTYNPLTFVGVERFHTRVWPVASSVAVSVAVDGGQEG